MHPDFLRNCEKVSFYRAKTCFILNIQQLSGAYGCAWIQAQKSLDSVKYYSPYILPSLNYIHWGLYGNIVNKCKLGLKYTWNCLFWGLGEPGCAWMCLELGCKIFVYLPLTKNFITSSIDRTGANIQMDLQYPNEYPNGRRGICVCLGVPGCGWF